jgi:hypothetical protein
MPEAARPPDLALLQRLDDLEEQVRKLNRRAPQILVINGTRTDQPSGKGPRVQLGLLTDGVHYGLEIWSSAGVHTVVASA